MAFYEGEPTDNPVNSENLVGIPRDDDDDTDSSTQQQKSAELRVPKKASQEFENQFKVEGEEFVNGRIENQNVVIDSNKLFYAREENEPLIGGSVKRRTYYSYQEAGQDRDDETIGIFRQNELTINNAGLWTIRRDDLAPGLNRNRAWLLKDTSAVFLSKGEDGDIELDKVIEDHLLLLMYRRDGDLGFVSINDAGDEALDEDHPDFGQRDDHAILLQMRGSTEGSMTIERPALPSGERVLDQVRELDIRDERVQMIDTAEEIKIVFYRRMHPDTVNFEVTIPKRQELVEFETGTSVDYRYQWEEDLVPEQIRKDPIHAPMELDDAWKRADLAAVIGVRIEKNVVP